MISECVWWSRYTIFCMRCPLMNSITVLSVVNAPSSSAASSVKLGTSASAVRSYHRVLQQVRGAQMRVGCLHAFMRACSSERVYLKKKKLMWLNTQEGRNLELFRFLNWISSSNKFCHSRLRPSSSTTPWSTPPGDCGNATVRALIALIFIRVGVSTSAVFSVCFKCTM